MVLSYGAGVNSTALAILLINNGWKGDVVFADTGCEWPDTYCFMDYFEEGWLKPRGKEIIKLGAEWRTQRYQLSLIEFCEAKKIIPYVNFRWCTVEYKVNPSTRWMKYRNISGQMLGVDASEIWRRPNDCRPLVDWGMDREDCIWVIKSEGLSIPLKSGCDVCPYQDNARWKELWERHYPLFDRVEQLEKMANQRRADRGKFFLAVDGSGVSLEQKRLSYEGQMALPNIDMDSLLKYKPCICGI